MMQQDQPDDYIIATGEANSLQDFVAESFAIVDLDWREHVGSDPTLFRPTDLAWSLGNPEKAARRLGWRASTHMRGVVAHMMEEPISTD